MFSFSEIASRRRAEHTTGLSRLYNPARGEHSPIINKLTIYLLELLRIECYIRSEKLRIATSRRKHLTENLLREIKIS